MHHHGNQTEIYKNMKQNDCYSASILKQDPNIQMNAYLFWHGHSMHIFRELSFVKPPNGTETTDKRLKLIKTRKNERENYLILVELLLLVQSYEQASVLLCL